MSAVEGLLHTPLEHEIVCRHSQFWAGLKNEGHQKGLPETGNLQHFSANSKLASWKIKVIDIKE